MTVDDLLRVLVVGLAGWRLASLFVNEEGPFDVFGRIRRWRGAEVSLDAPQTPDDGPGFLAGALQCVWCMSFYSTAAFWAAWEVHWMIPGFFASWAVAIIGERSAKG